LSEILAHGLLWLDVLRDYHGSIRSQNFRRFVTEKVADMTAEFAMSALPPKADIARR
jgi:hypothetical protein